MEEVYCALLLHKAGKEINEESVGKILDAAGIKVNEAKIKALVASLEGVDIQKAIEEAAVAPVAAGSSGNAGGEEKKETKEEKKEEDEVKSAEKAAEGLGALFG